MIDDSLFDISFQSSFHYSQTKTNGVVFSEALAVSSLQQWQIWSGFDYIIISEAYRTIRKALLGMSTLSFNPKRVDCKRKKFAVRHGKGEIIMLAQTTCAFCHDGRKSFYSLNKIYTSPYSVSPHKSSQTCPIPNTQVIITSAPHMNIKFSIASSDSVPCKQKPAFPYFHVNVSI